MIEYACALIPSLIKTSRTCAAESACLTARQLSFVCAASWSTHCDFAE